MAVVERKRTFPELREDEDSRIPGVELAGGVHRIRRPVIRLLLPALALGACDAPSSTSPSPGAAKEPGVSLDGELVTSLASIEGPWAIARFRGFEPSWRTNIGWRAAYVHVREDGLSYSIGCNHSGGDARIDRHGVLHKLSDTPSTLMGCAADAEVDDHDFYGFFSTKPRVTRIGEGRIRVANVGTELILERLELRRRADPARPEEIQGRWIPQFLENFSGSGMSGFSMEEPRGIVTITDGAIRWSGCPDAAVAISHSNAHRLDLRSRPKGDCDLGERPGEDGAVKLMRIMRSNPAVDRTGLHSIVLFTDTEAAHFQSEQSVLNPPPLPPAPTGATSPPPPPPPPPLPARHKPSP